MKTKHLIIIAILGLTFTSGCRTVVYVPVDNTPIVIEKTRIIPKTFDVVWSKTIELFANYNYPIKNLDKTSGFISSDYKAITGSYQYCTCAGARSDFNGKVEIINRGGNMNMLLKSISSDSTQVTVNLFYSATRNEYKYESLLSTNYVLVSSTRIDCESTGLAEGAIFEYLMMP